jgi:hypothetical protein
MEEEENAKTGTVTGFLLWLRFFNFSIFFRFFSFSFPFPARYAVLCHDLKLLAIYCCAMIGVYGFLDVFGIGLSTVTKKWACLGGEDPTAGYHGFAAIALLALCLPLAGQREQAVLRRGRIPPSLSLYVSLCPCVLYHLQLLLLLPHSLSLFLPLPPVPPQLQISPPHTCPVLL